MEEWEVVSLQGAASAGDNTAEQADVGTQESVWSMEVAEVGMMECGADKLVH